ncbi:MAG TPA: ABC transporter ATP-binding protein, partial [Sporolactobacillaceae bacterium]|nr:ABC transporter ATP-binding protein [Sporolactobacillaceae bacterium]
MGLFEAKNLTFHYPDSEQPALWEVSFSIEPGEFVVLCGPSGGGKSTLLRLLKREIAPHGHTNGAIFYKGQALESVDAACQAKEIGFVFQDPENQIVMDRVLEELVFGLENLGTPLLEIQRRLAEMVHAFGLEILLQKKTEALSGGQKQLINLASVLLLEPDVLLLDEPLAQLDPVTAKEFLSTIKRMNEDYGLTVLMVEHHLEDVMPLSDRLIVLDQGKKRYDGNPRKVIHEMGRRKEETFHRYLPSPTVLYLETFQKEGGEPETIPLNVKEGRRWLAQLDSVVQNQKPLHIEARLKGKKAVNSPSPILEARNIDFQYERDQVWLLDQLSVSVQKGECLTILGANGSGKSTLLKVLAGLIKPQAGALYFEGKKVKRTLPAEIGYLPQNPKLFFLHDSILEEYEQLTSTQGDRRRVDEEIEDYLHQFGLSEQKSNHPYDLSGGELQKAALIGVLLQHPTVLLLDEPTKGLDPVAKEDLASYLIKLKKSGMTLVMVTHDVEFASTVSDQCAMLFQGVLTGQGPVDDFFKGNTYYTTTVNRLTRNQETVPEVVTL